jgi:hypothetical protein
MTIDPARPDPRAPGHRSPTSAARAGLFEGRAVAAARAADAVLGAGPAPDAAWRERAARAVRMLAGALGVDPALVLARPDTGRRYGHLGALEVSLTVLPASTSTGSRADSGKEELTFIPEIGNQQAFLLLRPCPRCGRQVPTYRVLSLVDLGHILDPDRPTPVSADTEQFGTDPGHSGGCPLRRAAVTFGSAHR